jgi:hypothetical protein
MYSKLAGNEIHSIVAEGSKFFQEFIGQSFSYASYTAHTKSVDNFFCQSVN